MKINEIFRYARPYSSKLEFIDDLPNFFFATDLLGSRKTLLDAGINSPAILKAQDGDRVPVILIRSSAHKAGSEDTPWQDLFRPDFGHIRYFGDNKSPKKSPERAAGNALLLSQFKLHHSTIKEERLHACPILAFRAVSYSDFSPFIRLSSYQSHIEFAQIYEEKTKAMSAVTPTVRKLADQITQGITEPKEQARALYNWVSREIRYVAIYLGDGGYVPHFSDSIIRNRYGDCKDKNTLLVALLSAKGIEASSALINSSSSYVLPNLVTLNTFNHVITYLPQWDMYVDATQEFAPFGVLAFLELDKPTLLTALGRVGRTQKPDAAQNKVSTRVTMTVDPDGKIHGTSHTHYFGVEDLEARPNYEGIGSVREKKIIDDHLGIFRQIGTGKFIPSDPYDLNYPFEVKTEFSIEAITNMPGYGAMGVPVGLSPGELYIVSNQRSHEDFAPPLIGALLARLRSTTL